MPVQTRPPDPLPANSPLLPPVRYREVAYAIKAVSMGEADKGQQNMAMRWIVNQLCGTYDLPYRASSRDTDFALGKMFVGQQLVTLVNMPVDEIAKLQRLGPSISSGEDDELPNL